MKVHTVIATFASLFLLASCGDSVNSTSDILTQKLPQEGRTVITISTKYAVYLDSFENAAEKKFPNIDLVQVGNYTSNYSDEYAQQLANDDLTDIIITWPLNQAAQNCAERLIDLSGMKFTARYNISMLNNIAQNGALYYLPGPTQVHGVLYNKTLFEENGWSVPTDFASFVRLCQTIEASGIRSLQLSFWNKEVLRYAFMGFAYTESFSTPASVAAIADYNQGKGSLRDFALPALNSFQRLVEAGVLRPSDLDIRYPMREKMLYNRQCAMVSEGIALIPPARRAGNTDEFAVMPFFCPGDGAWGQLLPMQYIGLNKSLTKPQNKKKYDLALQVMDFISTPEGQLALSNGNTSMISSLQNNPVPSAPELIHMRSVIQSGHCVVFPTFRNAENALYYGLAGLLRGDLTQDQVIRMVDEQNQNPAPPLKGPVIGTASETFTVMETGNYVTDVLRAQTGADFALFLDNGKDGMYNARGITTKFYRGAITESDVTLRVLPVLQHGEKGYLCIATMTGTHLRNALEYSLDGGAWFYYASGLIVELNPTAVPGKRIKKMTDSAGNALQPDKLYTVAIMEDSVDIHYITTLETTNLLIRDVVIGDIQKKGTITPSKDGRLTFVF